MADDNSTRRADADDYSTRVGFVAGHKVFGRFMLEAIAGKGGMGVVWRVRDAELDETVALKFLPEVVARDSAAVDELKEETRRARRLTHPNIVRIHDFLRDEAMAAVSMEYVDGATLSQLRLEQPGKVLDAATLAPLVAQLCAALDYAHGQAKVVHRDLKPANILVTKDGAVKITDFGIARSLADTHTRLTGRVGDTSGTLVYMSPQQLRGHKPAPADDIYALGATLYELLTGKPPFFRGDIATQVEKKAPASLQERRAEFGIGGESIPAAWEETILACLAKGLLDRPQSAAEVAARLGLGGGGVQGFRSEGPRAEGAADRSAVLQPAPEKVGCGTAPAGASREGLVPNAPNERRTTDRPPDPRKFRMLLYAALAAAVIGLGLGAWWYWGAYLPEQQRKAEGARLAEVKRQNDERARLAAEQAHREALRLIAHLSPAATDSDVAAATELVARYAKNATPERGTEALAALGRQRDAIMAERDRVRLAAEQAQREALGWVAALPVTASDNELAVVGAKVELYSRNAPTERVAAVNAALAQQRSYIIAERERIRLANARGGVVVRTEPAGAQVMVGALEVGTSPLTVKEVKLGKYPVKVNLNGYDGWSGEVEVTENEFAPLDVPLERSTGVAQIASKPPGLEVEVVGRVVPNAPPVGGRQIVRTPAKLEKLPTGDYELIFHRRGRPDQRQTVTVRPNQVVTALADFSGGGLEIISTPPGAEVWSEGKRLGVTPVKFDELVPGIVEFELRLAGYEITTAREEVRAGDTARTTVSLEKKMGPEEGRPYAIPGFGLQLRWIPAGSFFMGSPLGEADRQTNEGPQMLVTISRGFWLGRNEVTQREWRVVMGNNPSHFQGDDRPVETVSWTEAMEFCRKLTENERSLGHLPPGFEYTLPTEAQWEYACRAGTTGQYAGSLDAMGWYEQNSGGTTHPVGQKQANAWGLHDMHGNVWEWCLDWYQNHLPGGSVRDPTGPSSGSYRVYRGGCWSGGARSCRSADRNWYGPGIHYYYLGFRLALGPVR